MSTAERRHNQSDRRRAPRGGRRTYDQPGRHPNLLLADSYEGARVPCARYLDRFGFQVDQAANGTEALAAIETRTPHVILVEDSLPEVSARKLLERLHEHPPAKTIPVIVIRSDFDSAGEPQPAGAAGLLVKPFALSSMLQEVRRVLRLHSPFDDATVA